MHIKKCIILSLMSSFLLVACSEDELAHIDKELDALKAEYNLKLEEEKNTTTKPKDTVLKNPEVDLEELNKDSRFGDEHLNIEDYREPSATTKIDYELIKDSETTSIFDHSILEIIKLGNKNGYLEGKDSNISFVYLSGYENVKVKSVNYVDNKIYVYLTGDVAPKTEKHSFNIQVSKSSDEFESVVMYINEKTLNKFDINSLSN